LSVGGSISEFDDKIPYYRDILLSSPRSFPLGSFLLQVLAGLYNYRYPQSGQKEDLDTSILYSTEAVLAASHSESVDQDTVQAFYLLAIQLVVRLRLFHQPGDFKHCIEYLRCLESQPLEAISVPSDGVKVSLLVALASQVELGAGDAARDMGEMMVRCRDLLASNFPQPLLKQAITALVQANDAYSRHSPASEYSEMLIDLLREANRRLGSHDPYVATELALHLSRRCHKMHLIDD
jgi:hypothetical protein